MSLDKGLTRAALKKIQKRGHEEWTAREIGLSQNMNSMLYRARDYGLLERISPGRWRITEGIDDLTKAYYDFTKKAYLRGAEKRYGKAHKPHKTKPEPDTKAFPSLRQETPQATVVFWGYHRGKKLYQARVGEFCIIGPNYVMKEADDG